MSLDTKIWHYSLPVPNQNQTTKTSATLKSQVNNHKKPKEVTWLYHYTPKKCIWQNSLITHDYNPPPKQTTNNSGTEIQVSDQKTQVSRSYMIISLDTKLTTFFVKSWYKIISGTLKAEVSDHRNKKKVYD